MQSLNSTSCARNITDEILEHISNDDLHLTSGTLIELVNIGPRLADLWSLPDINHVNNGNYSTKILKDYIEISSNLYHQLIAWDEMPENQTTGFATDLISTNEHLAFR